MRYFTFILLVVVSLSGNAQDTTRLSLLFAGDIMGHDSQIASAYNAKMGMYDYSSCFQFVKPYMELADIAIGNLELTLAGPPYKGYPQFSSPDDLAKTLKEVGFDVLVTANNHSCDRRRSGIERTIKVLDSLQIPHTGTFMDETDRLNNYPLILHKNGFKIALLNYTYGTNGIPVPSPTMVNLIDTVAIKQDLVRAKEKDPDVTIAFMHWGGEYQRLPRRQEKDLASFCFRHGVNLVIGSHPHVLQPMEWRKSKNEFVVYSLGNYVSGQRKQYTDGGGMAYVELEKIRYKPDSTAMRIDSAAYLLHWVYRTADIHKDYYLLPVPTFEKDTTGFIKDENSRKALETFINDSRTLYQKNNKSVPEIRQIPKDSVISYKIHWYMVPNDSIPLSTQVESSIDTFFGYDIQKMANPGEEVKVVIGKFETLESAKVYCKKISSRGSKAVVVRYVNGLAIDIPKE